MTLGPEGNNNIYTHSSSNVSIELTQIEDTLFTTSDLKTPASSSSLVSAPVSNNTEETITDFNTATQEELKGNVIDGDINPRFFRLGREAKISRPSLSTKRKKKPPDKSPTIIESDAAGSGAGTNECSPTFEDNEPDVIDLTPPTIAVSEGDPIPISVAFPDRLLHARDFWEHTIHAPREVLNWIDEGVTIGLVEGAEEIIREQGGIWRGNGPVTPEESQIRWDLVDELIRSGFVQERSSPCLVNLGVFLIKKPDGRYRFILNGRPLSEFLTKTDFSYETLVDFLNGVLSGSTIARLDLTDGFFACRLRPDQREFVGFTIQHPVTGKFHYIEFLVLPQGLSTSPYIFSRFTLAVAKHLRHTISDAAFITYLDDMGWAIGPSATLSRRTEINQLIRLTFLHCGWVLSQKKCIFSPTCTELILLGITIITSPTLQVDLPLVRAEKITDLIESMLSKGITTSREFFCVGGGLQSAEIVLGPSITMYLRFIYEAVSITLKEDITNLALWDKAIRINDDCKEELEWWLALLKKGVRRDYHQPPWVLQLCQLKYQAWVDAGRACVGSLCRLFVPGAVDPVLEYPGWLDKSLILNPGLLAQKYGHMVACQLLREIEQFDSSTLRETRGLLACTIIYAIRWRNCAVQIFVDNAALERIAIRGSRIPEIHKVIREWVSLCMEFNIKVQVIWIPRERNHPADIMSKNFLALTLDTDDYSLSTLAYQRVIKYFNLLPDIDLFAANTNNRCKRFYSRFSSEDSAGIDAFFQPEWGTNFYAFPPVDDGGRFLRYFLNPQLQGKYRLRGILIVPLWVRLESTRLLLNGGDHFIPQVRAWYALKGTDITKGAIGTASFLNLNKGGHKTPFVALLLDNTLGLPEVPPPQRFCLKSYYQDKTPCRSCAST